MTNRMENHECLRCGGLLVRIDTENPFHLWCSTCEEELKQLYWDVRNKNKKLTNVKKIHLSVFGKPMTLGQAKKALENA